MEVRRVPFPALRLGATLGSGATGDVFIGELGGAPVAVKRLKLAAIPNARAELSRRFRAEVDVLSRYAHPRLVRLLAWAEEEDPVAPHPFAIVLELLEEGSLGDWLRGPAGEPPQRASPGGAPQARPMAASAPTAQPSGASSSHSHRCIAQCAMSEARRSPCGQTSTRRRGRASTARSRRRPPTTRAS